MCLDQLCLQITDSGLKGLEKEDVNVKILRVQGFRPSAAASFEYYRLREHFDKLLESYNIMVKEYNDTVSGYPVCVIASVTGRKNLEIIASDVHSDN